MSNGVRWEAPTPAERIHTVSRIVASVTGDILDIEVWGNSTAGPVLVLRSPLDRALPVQPKRRKLRAALLDWVERLESKELPDTLRRGTVVADLRDLLAGR